MKIITSLSISLIVLAILVPMGVLLPHYFNAETAWGEWDIDDIHKIAGYVPEGLKKLSTFWNAPFPDYAFKNWMNKGLAHTCFSYVITGILGMIIVAAVMLIISRILIRKGN